MLSLVVGRAPFPSPAPHHPGRGLRHNRTRELTECVDTAELEDQLRAMDAALAERLADRLLVGVDWDRFDWAG
jgi:hypothetical protein